MATSKAQKLAVRKYRANNYETVSFEVRKGKRAEYKQVAESLNLSLAEFFKRAAESYGNGATCPPIGGNCPAQTQPTLSADQKKLVDEFSKLPVDAQKHFIKAFQAINNIQICPSYAPDKPTSND